MLRALSLEETVTVFLFHLKKLSEVCWRKKTVFVSVQKKPKCDKNLNQTSLSALSAAAAVISELWRKIQLQEEKVEKRNLYKYFQVFISGQSPPKMIQTPLRVWNFLSLITWCLTLMCNFLFVRIDIEKFVVFLKCGSGTEGIDTVTKINGWFWAVLWWVLVFEINLILYLCVNERYLRQNLSFFFKHLNLFVLSVKWYWK